MQKIQTESTEFKEKSYCHKFDDILGQFDSAHQQAILRARNGKVSAWLTVLPLARSQFDLSAQEFWDALAIRYKKPLRNVPDLCDSCRSQFSLSHALSCKKGGLVIQRHNEIRDAIGDFASLVWSQVRREPVVREADTKNGTPALIADLAISWCLVAID